eukprot:gene3925-7828_t
MIFLLLVSFLLPLQGFVLRTASHSRICLRPTSIALKATAIDLEVKTDSGAGPSKLEETFQWEKQWYPMAVDEITDRSKPHKVTLLGNDIVMWHDGSKWCAFDDSCPHRGVPLSEGRVEKNGVLLCAYHAWTWDGSGKCNSIPQSPSKEKETFIKKSESSCAKVYPTKEIQGLIWIWGEKGAPGSDVAIQAALKQPRLIDELTDPQYKGRIGKIVWNCRDVPYGWDMFMENTLDPAHVVVSHHNIIGNRYKDAGPILHTRIPSRSEIPLTANGEYNPSYPSDKGFCYIVEPGKRSGVNDFMDPQSLSTNDFRPPSLNQITANQPGGAKMILALYASPSKPGWCRHAGAQILIKPEAKNGKEVKGLGAFSLPLPIWILHAAASVFLHQDMVFLHHQERKLYASSNYAFGKFDNSKLTADSSAFASTYFMPNEQDVQVTTFRRWLAEKAGGGPRWARQAQLQGLPPVLDSAELFDVYNVHTKNCLICLRALKNLVRVRNVALVLAAVAGMVIKNTVRALATSGFLGLIALACHKFKGLYYKYEYSHQNNN